MTTKTDWSLPMHNNIIYIKRDKKDENGDYVHLMYDRTQNRWCLTDGQFTKTHHVKVQAVYMFSESSGGDFVYIWHLSFHLSKFI